MLLNFGMKNYKSFKEWVDVSFELKPSCPKNISQGKDYATVLCVNGPNASGKTNLLDGLVFFSMFCHSSFLIKPEKNIPFDSHFDNQKSTEFYVEFISNNIKYRYELVLTEEKVISEKAYRIKQKKKLLFERKNNSIVKAISEFKELKDIKKLRSNASIISIANQHEIKSILPIFIFFIGVISNLENDIYIDKINDTSELSKTYKKDEKLFSFVKEAITNFDVGIADIEIHSRYGEKNQEVFYPIFFHHRSDNLQSLLLLGDQSSGTKSLFRSLYLYWLALKSGGALVLDEFDINLHPHILPHLIDLFTDEEKNPKNAQLIFTTHNPNILDQMGKYRIFTLNKEENESFGYRLDEIPGDILRNDRSILPAYNSGKIGGIPKI